MFDTHAHLNFKRFKKNVDEVITNAKSAGVEYIVIPGTDVPTSQKAVEIAEKYEGVYAAVGIHPHHVFEYLSQQEKVKSQNQKEILKRVHDDMEIIEALLKQPKVVAVGEVGMDKHIYEPTKYENYQIDQNFVELQRKLLKFHIKLAKSHKKSLILHNREAKEELLPTLRENWDSSLTGKAVFHCCEPDEELLQFAKDHNMFIGVDGDITYYPEKQEFIKKVPLEMLVLETDSPFLLPEPLRTQKKYPNEPKNIPVIVDFIVNLRNISPQEIALQTTQNAKKIFGM